MFSWRSETRDQHGQLPGGFLARAFTRRNARFPKRLLWSSVFMSSVPVVFWFDLNLWHLLVTRTRSHKLLFIKEMSCCLINGTDDQAAILSVCIKREWDASGVLQDVIKTTCLLLGLSQPALRHSRSDQMISYVMQQIINHSFHHKISHFTFTCRGRGWGARKTRSCPNISLDPGLLTARPGCRPGMARGGPALCGARGRNVPGGASGLQASREPTTQTRAH